MSGSPMRTASRRSRRTASRRSQKRPPRKSPPRRQSATWQPSRWRAGVVWGILILAMLGLTGRLAHLQLRQGAHLAQIVQRQHRPLQMPRIARRSIVDSRGSVIAMDGIAYELYAHPALFNRGASQVAAALSQILEVPAAELTQQFRQQETGIQLSRGISEESADRIRALRLDGLELVDKQQRIYPQRDLFAPVVGFVNLEGEPQLGVELSLADQIALPPTSAEAPETTETAELSPNGQKLQLTLDSRLQRIAQQELVATVQEHSAKRGALMVMEADSGALRALAIAPTFDPNRYYEADIQELKNWAVSDLYEPGSTFKPINVAIALETGAVTPETTVYDSGQIQFGRWTIRNADYVTAGGHGTISIGKVLAYSSNVGMIRIMNQMPAATYYEWLQKLGLDQPTHIDLPAEATGQMKERDQFINSAVESATTAFGQGFALTPIQLLRYQAAIANGGKLVTPHVVKGLVDSQGGLQWQPERPAPERIFSPETSQQVLSMLEEVVREGTGKPAQLPGYRVGGKTGTAQKATAGGVYGQGRITSFVAVLPMENPRYVVLGVIDEPQSTNAYGSTVAAPLVKKVMESLLVIEGIPPSVEVTATEASP